MKTKNKDVFLEKSIEELKSLFKGAEDMVFSLRLEKMQNKLKNTRAIFLKRKEIARILTLIRQKELTEVNNEKTSK